MAFLSRSPSRTSAGGSELELAQTESVTISVDLVKTQLLLWFVIGNLVIADFLASVAAAEERVPYTLTRFFDGDYKVNFPTAAKTTLLLAIVVLMLGCWVASRTSGQPAARGWLLLAAATGFAFVDESTYLHQSLADVLHDYFDLHGVLRFAWTIVYIPAAVVVGFFLLRNLRDLRSEVRRRLLPGGMIYVLGALAFEPFKSHVSESRGLDSLSFKLLAATSDSLQLVGLTLLFSAVLYAAQQLARSYEFVLPPTR
jgi:hypothetical protein